MHINGRVCEGEVEPRTLMSDFIRHQAGLTGTHVGCEHGVCGACTVQLDAEPIRVVPDAGRPGQRASVRTVEGLAGPDGELHRAAAGLHRASRAAVRLLHVGLSHDRDALLAAGERPESRAAHRGRGPRGSWRATCAAAPATRGSSPRCSMSWAPPPERRGGARCCGWTRARAPAAARRRPCSTACPAITRSSAGKRVMTSQPSAVTTSCSSMRAADQPSRRRPEGLQREHHALSDLLGMVERDQPAEDRLLPDREARRRGRTAARRPPPRRGSRTPAASRPDLDDLGGRHARADEVDGGVEVVRGSACRRRPARRDALATANVR